MILEVKNLVKRFPIETGLWTSKNSFVNAVDRVSFSISERETLGLVGESGCGKSTVGKLILNLIEPDSGEIIFCGENILKVDNKELRNLRKSIQIIFQDPFASLNPRMNIAEIISEPLRVHKVMRESNIKNKVYELLDFVGLQKNFYNRYPHEMSGGQRQRIAIARAIALSPKLIIADEPLSSLDVSIQKDITDLFLKLQKEYKISYLFISHDLRVVKNISNNIIVMYLGKFMETGDVDSVFFHPKHPYTKALILSVPKTNPEIKKERIILKGDILSSRDVITGCRFRTRCWKAEDICKEKEPELIETNNNHKVACHFPL